MCFADTNALLAQQEFTDERLDSSIAIGIGIETAVFRKTDPDGDSDFNQNFHTEHVS